MFANDTISSYISEIFPNGYIIVFCIMYVGVIILPVVGLILCRMVKKCGYDGAFRKIMEIAYAAALGLVFGIPGILVMILLMLMHYRKSKH